MSTLAVRIRPHYPWVVVAATFVVLVTAAGFRATTGVLLLPLEETFGWSIGADRRRGRPEPLGVRPGGAVCRRGDRALRRAPGVRDGADDGRDRLGC